MGRFGGVEVPEVVLLSAIDKAGAVTAQLGAVVDPTETPLVRARLMPVRLILRVGAFPQVANAVVRTVTVDVVNLTRWHLVVG